MVSKHSPVHKQILVGLAQDQRRSVAREMLYVVLGVKIPIQELQPSDLYCTENTIIH